MQTIDKATANYPSGILFDIHDRLARGWTLAEIAEYFGFDIGTLDRRPAVVLPGYLVTLPTSESCPSYYDPTARSAKSAAERYSRVTLWTRPPMRYHDVVWMSRMAVDSDGNLGKADDSNEVYTIETRWPDRGRAQIRASRWPR